MNRGEARQGLGEVLLARVVTAVTAVIGAFGPALIAVAAASATAASTRVAAVTSTAAPISAALPINTSEPINAYHESRVLIPMRDGVRLEAFILSPPDSRDSYPILLNRTPYDPTYRKARPGAAMAKAGYIFVTQSVRGRYGSEGTFVHMRPQMDTRHGKTDIDESTDTFDTIDWLVKHIPNNNGRVGLRGISYGGFYAAAGMIDAHPALLAVSPQAPQADWFMGDDIHHNGAFLLASAFSFMPACDRLSTGSKRCGRPIDPGTEDGYRFFLDLGPLRNAEPRFLHGDVPEWTRIMAHGTYDDLWRSRNLLPHLINIRPAVLAVSGWYDANNLYGALHVFDAVRRTSNANVTLVLGPWTHGQWARDRGESAGALHFGSATSEHFDQEMELPFFEAYLKGNGRPNLPVAHVFDTGSMRWSSFEAWPPKTATKQSFYLAPKHGLQIGDPPATTTPAYDEYVSDPEHPVPFVADHGFDMDVDYMAQDQRFASNRADVLTYETAPLSADLTIIGPVSPRLVVSTSGTDSDWVVKLIDVHPSDGLEELVRGDVMRGKFRKSFRAPTAMRPNEPTNIDFTMTDVFHTFKKGHRIRVQVQSSWFPLIDRNPQRFVDIYSARKTDFQKATQRVFHSGQRLSRIEANVLPTIQ